MTPASDGRGPTDPASRPGTGSGGTGIRPGSSSGGARGDHDDEPFDPDEPADSNSLDGNRSGDLPNTDDGESVDDLLEQVEDGIEIDEDAEYDFSDDYEHDERFDNTPLDEGEAPAPETTDPVADRPRRAGPRRPPRDPGFVVIDPGQVREAGRHVVWEPPTPDGVSYGRGEEVQYPGLDENGNLVTRTVTRPTGIRGQITRAMIDEMQGTPADRNHEPPGFLGGEYGHARAHLLGRQFGGPGDEGRNIVTGFNDANSGAMQTLEGRIASWFQADANLGYVDYMVIPEHHGNAPVPENLLMHVDAGPERSFTVRIPNRPNPDSRTGGTGPRSRGGSGGG